jgi:hypothetical protein
VKRCLRHRHYVGLSASSAQLGAVNAHAVMEVTKWLKPSITCHELVQRECAGGNASRRLGQPIRSADGFSPDRRAIPRRVAITTRPPLLTVSTVAIYDVMRVGDGELTYPVPWATTATSSAIAKPAQYREALRAAGFSVVAERNRRDFALAFFDQLRAKTAAAGGPPPLGLHILMGRNTPDKVQNMIQNISNGRIAPVELLARKA